MRKLGLHELRKEYLDFFREKEHLVVPSFSLVPKDDDSLLLIGAGMAPLKKYFTGEDTPPKKRMATCQKCIRTGDIENVGKTDRHATFFEMLGNFSFGDYFKLESMEWAWEFLHERLEIPAEDLWVTVYKDDDEAHDLWRDEIGLPEEKIVRLGKEDNFWELEVGPSGPCSEIFVDRGKEYGCGSDDCLPGCCDRFIEVWNLVFTQFDKDAEGNYHPLSNPNIDTGMGLERVVTVLEGADNIFEIEAIQDIIKSIEKVSGYKYGTDENKDESVRVITDHGRAMTFLVSDGVLPSNEGRGYVLRRLIRRAARHGKLLGVDDAFLTKVVDAIIDSWKIEYKDLEENREDIKKIILLEENRFQETIDSGIERLESYIKELKKGKDTELSGEKAFMLYDTYGFPVDLTKEILEEKGLSLDEKAFEENMEEQRTRAREARAGIENVGWGGSLNKKLFKELNTEFTGYDTISSSGKVLLLVKEDSKVEELKKDEEGILVLNKTPFYGESGGQTGDKGSMSNDDVTIEVLDTQLVDDEIVIHMVKIKDGVIRVEDEVKADVEGTRRENIKRNHSATHLLHKALKEVLGDHVNQAGSLVLPNRLRFDITHFERISEEEIKEIEARVNEIILKNLPVEVIETSLEEANKQGVVGLFESKYGEEVRVVKMGDYSAELCGGTHVQNTSEIGLFKIVSETGVAAGVRRIEAITGEEVYNLLLDFENKINKASKALRADSDDIVNRVKSFIKESKEKDKEIQRLRNELASDISTDLINSAKEINGVKYVAYNVEDIDMENMRNLGDELRDKLGSVVVVLASTLDDKLTFVSTVTDDLIKKGIKAGDVVREVAQVTGGSGGGRPNMAQAGGKDIDKLEEALKLVPEIIKKNL